MFTPGKDKRELVKTLEYYNVNRVNHYNLGDWVGMYGHYPIFFPWVNLKWGIRSFIPGWSGFGHGVPTEEVLQLYSEGKLISGVHYICDSMIVQDNTSLVCNGEVLLYKDSYYVWEWAGFINYNKGLSCRTASTSSEIVYIRNRHQVPKLIFNLVWEKKLVDYVVEFSIYTEPVGIYKKNLLIWEIRKY